METNERGAYVRLQANDRTAKVCKRRLILLHACHRSAGFQRGARHREPRIIYESLGFPCFALISILHNVVVFFLASSYCFKASFRARSVGHKSARGYSQGVVRDAERCSRIIAKPPSESAVKAWFYNLTNSLQQIMNDEGVFPVLFPRRILTSVSNCRNLRSASPSFSKDGCTHRVKSVLRLAKRQNKFTLQIGAHGKTGQCCLFLFSENFCEQNSFISPPDLWAINGASPRT